jgi:hypothetical protein
MQEVVLRCEMNFEKKAENDARKRKQPLVLTGGENHVDKGLVDAAVGG